ncbi:phage major capsid protein [Nonlabens sp. SCSIO 43208]|uniref:phage major capsid protein n=1 Tax=Nonlabens sp. SCSIO 43208 TaxID=2793009 RepID=UPI003D6B6DDF
MKKSVILKQQRAAKVTAQGQLIEARNATANGTFTDEQQTQFRTLEQEITDLDTQIANEEAIEAAQARAAAQAADTAPAIPGGRQERGEQAEKRDIQKRASILKAIRDRSNGKQLEGAEKELDAIGREDNRNAKVDTPNNAAIVVPMIQRADQQTVTQDSGNYGGQLVQDQAPRVQDPFMPRLFLEDLGATVLTGLTGGDIPMPNAQNFNFEWLAEGAKASKQKQTFTGPSLSPKRASTNVGVSNQLIMQTSGSAEEIIRRLLRQGAARIMNAAAINGAGGVAPLGVLNTSGVKEGTGTSAQALTHALAVELRKLINAEDATSISRGWIMHPLVQAAAELIKKDAGSGRFLLEPGADTFMGEKFVSTTLVPTLDASGTDVYPLIYGDFSQLFVGQWGAMSLVVDPYTDADADSIRLIPNLHAGVAIAKPDAFAKNEFISEATS